MLDIALGLEQAVQPPRGGRRLCQKQITAIKLGHILDPVRLEDRFASRNRQRMEGADGPLRITLQIVKKRGFVALANAFQNGQVQLNRLFHRIQHTAHMGRAWVAGNVLRLAVRHQINVQLRPVLVDGGSQLQTQVFIIDLLHHAQLTHHAIELWHGVVALEANAFKYHHGVDIAVARNRTESILKTAHHHGLVDELVLIAPLGTQQLHVACHTGAVCWGHNQHLKIRAMWAMLGRPRQLCPGL